MLKYPLGIQTFEKIREDGFFYVTRRIWFTAWSRREWCIPWAAPGGSLSRPRRFGKSLLVSTLKSYYEGRKELFEGLAMAELETEWFEYPVFHVDFNGVDFLASGQLEGKLEQYVSEWELDYGKSPAAAILGDRFAYVLRQAHQRYGRRCVVLVDEYDKPLLDVLDTGCKTTLNG